MMIASPCMAVALWLSLGSLSLSLSLDPRLATEASIGGLLAFGCSVDPAKSRSRSSRGGERRCWLIPLPYGCSNTHTQTHIQPGRHTH
uniref:Putative secreted protein n=1 Tax=Anopheles marajoara TaxID=58244 RepID=A0A2M4CAD3_9DIPT